MTTTEQIRNIKFLRMTPAEKFLYDIFKTVEIEQRYVKVTGIEYDNFILLKNNIKIIQFIPKFKQLNIHYDSITWHLKHDYNIKTIPDCEIIIKKMLWNVLEIDVKNYTYFNY